MRGADPATAGCGCRPRSGGGGRRRAHRDVRTFVLNGGGVTYVVSDEGVTRAGLIHLRVAICPPQERTHT